MLDTGIADRLRAKGLTVVEVDGWRERGHRVNGTLASFDPHGSVDHHTAGGRTGDCPSLGICINGRSDLPGPLCNVLMGRSNTCYVVAAGRANHAGSGGWRGLSGNSSVYGIERENCGSDIEPWRPDQTDAAARAHAALIEGRAPADMVCEHKEWAPARKIDAHTVAGSTMRSLVSNYLGTNQGEPVAGPCKTISKKSNPGAQFAIIGDEMKGIGSLDELNYYIATGLVVGGGPVIWPDAYFDALKALLDAR
jgi:hypothetical protein